jgi:hypothetical protein
MGFRTAVGFALLAGGSLYFIHIERFRWAAIQSFLDFGAKVFDFDFAEFLGVFEKSKAVANDFAGGCVSSALDETFDKAFEMVAERVA